MGLMGFMGSVATCKILLSFMRPHSTIQRSAVITMVRLGVWHEITIFLEDLTYLIIYMLTFIDQVTWPIRSVDQHGYTPGYQKLYPYPYPSWVGTHVCGYGFLCGSVGKDPWVYPRRVHPRYSSLRYKHS
ncbi:hypothetical protein BU15DRAFT_63321 [Melanogaster broomeanus]|nr:hypothetical protein BU15DRAFT_63321 [Melanogaster broomeanus]